MGFAPKAECPECGTKTKVRVNPTQCDNCKTNFNLVTRTVQVKLNPDQELIEEILDAYHQLGEFYLDKLRARFSSWTIVKKRKGECFNCGDEKNLTMKKEGKLYCSPCGKEILYGDNAKSELKKEAKKEFTDRIPRKSYFRTAFKRAHTLFKKWISDNWGAFVGRSEFEKNMQQCKKEAAGVEIDGEPDIITKLRKEWAAESRPSTPFRFFDRYVRGPDINQANRSKRRKRLHDLSSQDELKEEERNFNDLALQMAAPACEGCEHLHEYSWGYECERYIRRAKITDFPDFPTNLAGIKRGTYQIDPKKIKVYLWKPRKQYNIPIIATDKARKRLREDYDFPDWSEGRKVVIRRDKETGEYFFDYPLRNVAKVVPGGWKHFIGFGPKRTCVLSADGNQEKVEFFKNGKVPKLKEHYAKIRREVDRPEVENYWDNRPRHKERDRIEKFCHQLTHEITEYISQYPGKVFVLNFQKELYDRRESNKSQLNQRLRRWAPFPLRQKLGYKLELAGLVRDEIEFDLSKEAVCPYCGLGWDKTWQQLIIERQVRSQKCPCGADTNVLLAMNKQALSQQQE